MEDGICTIPHMFHPNHAKTSTTKIRIISNQDCYLRITNLNYGLDWFVLTHPRSLLHNYMPLTLTLLICFYSLRFVNVMWTMGKCCLVSTMRWTSFTITNIRRTARQVPPPPPSSYPLIAYTLSCIYPADCSTGVLPFSYSLLSYTLTHSHPELLDSQVLDQRGIWGWIWLTSTRGRARYT